MGASSPKERSQDRRDRPDEEDSRGTPMLVCGRPHAPGAIALRTALGASRRRIVLQLFAKALVLSVVAAAVGLDLAGFGLGSFS